MDIWNFIETLEGRTLHTLDPNRSSPFTVEAVTDQSVAVRTVHGTITHISREKVLECWETLVEQQEVDLNIDLHIHLRLGGSASYVAAIFACVPGVLVHTKPIVLEYHTN